MIYLGADPGIKGAVATVQETSDGLVYKVLPVPIYGSPSGTMEIDAVLLADMIFRMARGGPIKAAVEDVHSMPRDGVCSAFSFGKSLGILLGTLGGNGIRPTMVTPQKWRADLGIPGASGKQGSVDAALRITGGMPMRRTRRCRVEDNNMADAICIAEWLMVSMTK